MYFCNFFLLKRFNSTRNALFSHFNVFIPLVPLYLDHFVLLKLSATKISTTDNLPKVCILLALVNMCLKQLKKYMVTMKTTETSNL